MTTPVDARIPTSATENRRLRLLAVISPIAVVVSAVVWNAGAAMLDASSIDQSSSSWGYGFASGIVTYLAGAPLLILVTLTTILAQFVPSTTRGGLVAGVVVCALAGFALGVLGLVFGLTGRYDGDAAFAALTVAASFVLLAPGWFAWDAVVRR